ACLLPPKDRHTHEPWPRGCPVHSKNRDCCVSTLSHGHEAHQTIWCRSSPSSENGPCFGPAIEGGALFATGQMRRASMREYQWGGDGQVARRYFPQTTVAAWHRHGTECTGSAHP